ncbi:MULTISPECIES: hypothetical protein [unclassified Leeuwenhoekiella]|uniref:hypothetical protein n=1 Tax=unclassified Leeuwenhoekiella TaxID=2615029 RepID=UPI0025C37F4B|nr:MULTISPECIES: hypothetical protein [unclassified Leeuwenhoekiella]|tara:strand:+ start:52773 stop:52931 length:159 start_codon:yes stop_codon:yes gene_type:complete
MKLKTFTLLLFVASISITNTSCEPDRFLEETTVVSDSGSENNKEQPRDPDED